MHDKVITISSFKKLFKHIIYSLYDKLEMSSILIFCRASIKFFSFSFLLKWLKIFYSKKKNLIIKLKFKFITLRLLFLKLLFTIFKFLSYKTLWSSELNEWEIFKLFSILILPLDVKELVILTLLTSRLISLFHLRVFLI